MQISTDSWHYRFILRHSEYAVPKNLCSYMRALMYCMLVVFCRRFAIAMGVAFGVAALISPLLGMANLVPDSWYATGDNLTLFTFLNAVGYVAYSLTALFLSVVGFGKGYECYQKSNFRNRRRDAKTAARLQPKTPNILVEWLKSMHDKTCKRLDFISNDAVDTNS